MSLTDLSDRRFWIANEDEIKSASTTDAYFLNTLQVLRKKQINPRVRMEVYARELPEEKLWGVVSGIYEVGKLLEGLPITVQSMDEGEIFQADSSSVLYEPVLQIEGNYADFAQYENAILGTMCSSTSVSTKAAHLRLAAGEKSLLSFGTRRVHPAIAPLVERAAYIGGADAISNVLAARMIGQKPVGTMPHSLILCFGDAVQAWKAFDQVMPKDIPRIALVDTFCDEKTEAILASKTLGDRLDGIRIDTPSSRRGDLRKIVEEVRWELFLRGRKNIQIIVSGGIDEQEIRRLSPFVDGFGIGTSLSAAPVIDFSAKIVEVKVGNRWSYRAKRGDIAGKKAVWRKEQSFEDWITIEGQSNPRHCRRLLSPLLTNGRLVRPLKSPSIIRKEVVSKIRQLRTLTPILLSDPRLCKETNR
uniref:nicotinate phosphoribosyltransferase n=1 Tax=uncultured marine thaumarchaeote KM3_72_A09 TaxID=1456261 RepID=A0A075HPX8_9ARCH|nr:nicotinate phosphoribosyltransferase (pncB, NAPRT1) [uncultured marine thaumarchaeote KM3_72_A09]